MYTYVPGDIKASVQLLNGTHECPLDILCALMWTGMWTGMRRMVARTGPSKFSLAAEGSTTQPVVSIKPLDVITGATARTASQALIYPIDTLKTRMQVSATNARAMSLGLSNLFIGFAGSMVTFVPSAVVYFGVSSIVKEAVKKMSKEEDVQVARFGRLLSSGAAAFSASFFRVPADVLKHRVQAYVYPTISDAAGRIIHTQGVTGLYAGFGATIMRDVPEIALQFFLYEELQKAYRPSANGSQASASALQNLVLGGTAGALAAVITNPLDVIKTRLQSGGARSFGCAVDAILTQKGLLGMWAGAGPRVLMTTIQCATFFAFFETLNSVTKPVQRVSTSTVQTKAEKASGPRAKFSTIQSSRARVYQCEQRRSRELQKRQMQVCTAVRPIYSTQDIMLMSTPLALVEC